MAISIGGNTVKNKSDGGKVTYNGKECTEVWYKSSPSATAIKVWPDDKYYLLLRWTPGTASTWPNDKYKIIRQSPGGQPRRGGRLVTWRNVPDGDSNWHELLFEYDASQGDMTFYPGDVYGKKYTTDFIQWGDGATEDTIIRTMDSQYNSQSNPLVITAYFKGGVSPGPEPPIPTGKAYLTQNRWPKGYASGSKYNGIAHNPLWKLIKIVSEENPNSMYFEGPQEVPFTCVFQPQVQLSDYPIQYWTLEKPDGTVLRFDDLDAHEIVIDQPGEWKENSYWSEPPKPVEFTITSITDGYVTVKPSTSIKAEEGSTKQVMYQISSSSGRIFDSIYIDGVKQSTPKELSAMYTFTNITSDRTINVTTKVKPQTTYTIQAYSDAYSSISPWGINNVIAGGSQKFTITVIDTSRKISAVIVDGKNVGVVSSYTFTNVQANHEIEVKTEPKTINVKVGGSYSFKFDGKVYYPTQTYTFSWPMTETHKFEFHSPSISSTRYWTYYKPKNGNSNIISSTSPYTLSWRADIVPPQWDEMDIEYRNPSAITSINTGTDLWLYE